MKAQTSGNASRQRAARLPATRSALPAPGPDALRTALRLPAARPPFPARRPNPLRLAGLLAALALAGCAAVEPYEREKLSDPIMDFAGPMAKQSLEQKFFSTREGSFGGGAGVGGGCGCAK